MWAKMTMGWAALIQMLEAIPTWGLKAICRVFMTILEVRPEKDGALGREGRIALMSCMAVVVWS